MDSHCLTCKKKTAHHKAHKAAVKVAANGRPFLHTVCAHCQRKKSRTLSKSEIGSGFFGDLWEGFKMPFKAISNITKPLRPLAGKLFNQLGPVKALGIDVTPYVGMGTDFLLGD